MRTVRKDKVQDKYLRDWMGKFLPTYLLEHERISIEFSQPEEDVEFSYCFFVHGITGEALDTEYHSYEYHHICSRKPAFPHYETTWYFVGSFNGAEILSQVLPKHYYIVMLQSHMKFVFLKETKVKLRIEDMEYEITFQSLEQSQAFYLMIPHDIAMKYAVSARIYVHSWLWNNHVRILSLTNGY